MKLELRQQFRIESARFLPHLPKGHPCRRMHGHSFLITLRLIGEMHPKIGWVKDYNEILATAKPVIDQMDHVTLNELPGLENPTSENLAIWLYDDLKPLIPELAQVIISETPSTECRYPVL